MGFQTHIESCWLHINSKRYRRFSKLGHFISPYYGMLPKKVYEKGSVAWWKSNFKISTLAKIEGYILQFIATMKRPAKLVNKSIELSMSKYFLLIFFLSLWRCGKLSGEISGAEQRTRPLHFPNLPTVKGYAKVRQISPTSLLKYNRKWHHN